MTSPTFAAAQARILERRRSREAELAAARDRHDFSASSSRLSKTIGRPVYSLWQTLDSRMGTSPVHRVGQVDAELLDEELLSLLKGQVADALKYYDTTLQADWSEEILLALRAVLFKLSIWDHDASYGARLQNLAYSDARSTATGKAAAPTNWQKGAYGFVTVFGRYGWAKWQDWLLDQESEYGAMNSRTHFLSRLTDRVSTAHRLASFISFCVFLVNGRYRTLTDRLLSLRLVSPSSQVRREVSFEYLNRQLVWHAFTEFLLFLLPLVGITRWRRWLSRAWRKTKAALRPNTQDSESEEPEKSGPLASLPERTCAICYSDANPTAATEAEILGANAAAGGGVIGSAQTDIVNPYETIPCGCIYCFVCLATKIEGEEGEGWMCLRCGEVVKSCRPWRGDVLVEDERKPTAKSVGFADDIENVKGDYSSNGRELDQVSDTERWQAVDQHQEMEDSHTKENAI